MSPKTERWRCSQVGGKSYRPESLDKQGSPPICLYLYSPQNRKPVTELVRMLEAFRRYLQWLWVWHTSRKFEFVSKQRPFCCVPAWSAFIGPRQLSLLTSDHHQERRPATHTDFISIYRFFTLRIWQNTDFPPWNWAECRFFFSGMRKGFLYIFFSHTDFFS